MTEPKKKSGFRPAPPPTKIGAWHSQPPCLHPGHNPPTHLFVPAGTEYHHVCPECGQESVIRSNQVFVGNFPLGGLRRGELHVISAHPGAGRSTFGKIQRDEISQG